MQDGRDLPRHERLLAGAHRRHRRAVGGAGRGRHAAFPGLRLAERRPALQLHLHAPHVRLRNDARAGGGGAGGAQRACVEQPQGLLPPARERRGRAGEPHDLQAAAPARLLRGDRQRHRHRRHRRRPRARYAPSARADPGRGRALLQAARRHALPGRADLDRGRALRPRHPVAQRRRRPGGHRRDRLLRRLHLHHPAAARGLRLLPQGRGRRLRQRRHHPARRPAPEQHQRRAPVRGLHARHEHGDRERAPAAPRRRRQLPRWRRRPAPAHLRLPRGRLPAGASAAR